MITCRTIVCVVLIAFLTLFKCSISAVYPSLNTPPLFNFQREWILPEDEKIGNRIAIIRVEDQEHDKIEFGIQSNYFRDGSKYFTINSTTGEVLLKNSLQGLSDKDLYLVVTAFDGFNKAKIEVRIRIIASLPEKQKPIDGNKIKPIVVDKSTIRQNSTDAIKSQSKSQIDDETSESLQNLNPYNYGNISQIGNKSLHYGIGEILSNHHQDLINSEAAKYRLQSSSVNQNSSSISNIPVFLWITLFCFVILTTITINLILTRHKILQLKPPISKLLASPTTSSTSDSNWSKISTAKLAINKSDSSGTGQSGLSFASEYDPTFMFASSSWSDYEKPINTNSIDNLHSNNAQFTDHWEYPRHKLRILGILGEGCFGRVWKCEAYDLDKLNCASIVAVKAVKEGVSCKEKEGLVNELSIMKQLKAHPNVVTLLGCCTEKEPYFLILEYVPFGTLQNYLRNQRDRDSCQEKSNNLLDNLTAKDLTLFAYQIAKGMEHISSEGIIHRDLAARNVLIGGNKICKIADFGFSRTISNDCPYESKSEGRLPIRWMAPESLQESTFSIKSDVWSFGVLMWEIITLGSTPYPGLDTKEVMKKVLEGYRLDKPDYCKRELYNIMFYCWENYPNQRPDFVELISMLDKLISSETDYIELDRFPEHSYYNIIDRMPGEKL